MYKTARGGAKCKWEVSCHYKAYDKFGKSHDDEKTYLEKGTTFPPLQHEGGYWVMDHE